MNKKPPAVSIGMPVFNGENFLEETLQSIHDQTFEDFELIISDNASTDRTEAICYRWAASDPRVRYFRNDRNYGAAYNFNRTFELSRGEYFKWAAHDDLISPNFIECCVSVLERSPEAVVAYTPSVFIDENGRPIRYRKEEFRMESPSPSRRFWQLVSHMGHCIPVFGLIRASALTQTRLIGAFPHADRVTLLELSLLGQFREADSALFYLRQHSGKSQRANPTHESLLRWYGTSITGPLRHSFFRLTKEKLEAIRRSELGPLHKLVCRVRVVIFTIGWLVPAAIRKLWKVVCRVLPRERSRAS